MVDDERISAFLQFGYLPRAEEALLRRVLASLSSSEPLDRDDADLVGTGSRVLRSCFEAHEGRLHVVPLSGGLDSRAVLAGLLAAGARGHLVAVTMGTPGTFDFEIAKRVAERAGVDHELIDLRRVELDERSLQRALVDSGATSWAFDVFYHRLIPAHFGADATYWSGFMGGEVAGSHVATPPPTTWTAAVRDFVAHETFCRGGALVRPGSAPESLLPPRPWCDPRALSYGDQLDFGVRQQSLVCRTVVVEGYDYRTPFLTDSWLRFILGAPAHLRRGERLFKRILVATFPDLFSLPSKNTAGLRIDAHRSAVTAKLRLMKIGAAVRTGSLRRDLARRRLPVPFRMLNYLDFADAIRSKPDVRGLVVELVRALDRRHVVDWISGTRLWESHERLGGDFDLACALTVLASLELNLRADAVRETPVFGAQDR